MDTDQSDRNILARTAALLGGPRLLKRTVKTLADLEAVVTHGIPFRSFEGLVAQVAKTDAERAMVEDVVAPRTTRLRRAQAGVLSPEESERVERIARLQALAEYVFGSAESAHAFLCASHWMLGDAVPITLARTELGARRVERILRDIEWGLPV